MNRVIHVLLAALAPALPLQAAVGQDQSPFDISGDLRLRFEQDWDSQTASGAKRMERTRARIRGRINGKMDLGAGFTARGRVRTGGERSQQNANITFADFDDNRTDEMKVVVDQYSLAWQGKSGGFEVAKMAFPFFTANEYFWDGDIAPFGLAGNFSLPLSEATKLKFNAGGFRLPVGLRDYSGSLFAGQAVLESGPTTVAAGLFGFDADTSDVDRLVLLDGNGSRDYTILAVNTQYKLKAGGKPFVLGADFYQNLQGYGNSADALSRTYKDERTGVVLSAAWGASTPGSLQLGYRYFHMEKFAVNASYAHDDVARFGTAAQATLTDLEGHDLYANYALTAALTLGARLMVVERLRSSEDGNRARLDAVYKF